MQGGVYKRRLPKCFHAAPSRFRTPPTPHHPIGYHFSLRQQFRHHQYPPKRPYRKCITFAELPQILHKNASCLRNFRKYNTKMLLICGTSSNVTQRCILLADFRKYNTKTLLACGISANIVQKCILFAELPQMLHKSAFCLRNFRKYDTKTHLACGTSANSMQIKNTPYYIIAPFAR